MFRGLLVSQPSQYANICFPLHVLNYASPHLLLAWSQLRSSTNMQYIWNMCILQYKCSFFPDATVHLKFYHLNYRTYFPSTKLIGGCVLKPGWTFQGLIVSFFLIVLPPFWLPLIAIYYMMAIMHLWTAAAPNSYTFVLVVSKKKKHEGFLLSHGIK